MEENPVRASLDLTFFDTLRAEDEPFLSRCYYPPRDFEMMVGPRSAVILGDAGSGKTALARSIMERLCPPGEKPRFLLILWTLPVLLHQDAVGLDLVMAQFRRVMDLVVRALILHLADYPADWEAAPQWSRDTLQWFVQEYLDGDLQRHVQSLGADVAPEGQALLQRLADTPAVSVFRSEPPPDLVMAELMKALQTLDLSGIVILMDGIERWVAVDQEQIAAALRAFLSTLPFFECPGFAFKLLLPAVLERSLGTAGAVLRGRVDWHRLKWDFQDLQAIVERRLALMLGEEAFSFERLAATDLQKWLSRCGGESPRGWLHHIRPFVGAYLQNQRVSLSPAECLEIQQRHPPQLFIDPSTGQIIVGHRLVPPLADGLEAVLNHLYDFRGRVCSRRDLYVTYMDALYPDRDPYTVLTPADYSGIMDTVLWRLRQAIEPQPTRPVLLVTVKRKGVRLDHAL